jgi:negative regulator of flagellin synthesis FlgM
MTTRIVSGTACEGVREPSKPAARFSTSAAAASARRSPGDDTVKLTGDAMNLHELDRSLAREPSLDAARIARLRQALADGSFSVDGQVVADKLLQSERELG